MLIHYTVKRRAIREAEKKQKNLYNYNVLNKDKKKFGRISNKKDHI
jgi:hypothetical protein